MSTPLEIEFAELGAEIDATAPPAAGVSVPTLVRGWLEAGPRRFETTDRAVLTALCRQIDVRKRVDAAYTADWRPIDPPTAAEATVVAGLAAVLLANAAAVGAPGSGDELNDGWGLKCTNSALKALDLLSNESDAATRHGGVLRGVALETLDRIRTAPR